MKAYVFCFAVWMGVLSSCTSLEVLSFDQLNPAKISYPESISHVAVVNNMPETPEYRKPGIITLGDLDAPGKKSAEMLAGALADSKYFDQVMICDSVVHPANGAASFSQPEVARLAEGLDADLIFSLDRVSVHTRKEEVYYPGLAAPWPVLRMQVKSVASVYVPSRMAPVQVLSVADSADYDIQMLSSDKQLLEEGTRMAVAGLCRQMVPYWTTADRLYYNGGTVEMRDAGVYVKEHNWEQACEQWKLLYDRSKAKGMKFRAAFNLALGNEMLGDLQEALNWLKKSRALIDTGSDEERIVKFYESQLEQRTRDLMYLNTQMGRFQNKF